MQGTSKKCPIKGLNEYEKNRSKKAFCAILFYLIHLIKKDTVAKPINRN
jgi:hypothetical protein